MHPERLEVPMLKARVGGEGVLREGIRREREGSTVELTGMASSVVTARLKLALVRPIVGLKLSPPIFHDLETGARSDVLIEILRRASGRVSSGLADVAGGHCRSADGLIQRLLQPNTYQQSNGEQRFGHDHIF